MAELPQYRCHKVVRAAKICGVQTPSEGVRLFLRPAKASTANVMVPDEWLQKHGPKGETDPTSLVGGYYVQYEDGYTSWSPAGAFEGGYTLIENLEGE